MEGRPGFDPVARPERVVRGMERFTHDRPLNPRTRLIHDRPAWTGYEVVLDVLPEDLVNEDANARAFETYQAYAVRLVERGFIGFTERPARLRAWRASIVAHRQMRMRPAHWCRRRDCWTLDPDWNRP